MDETRWKLRFENFNNSHNKLKHAVDAYVKEPQNELFQMATIQAFEFTFELGWKTMRDFLKYKGMNVNFTRDIIKEAFATNIIEDGQAWIDMMEDRNLTSHAYSEQKAIDNIQPYWNSLRDKKYCKKARTYLADKNFNDEFKPALSGIDWKGWGEDG